MLNIEAYNISFKELTDRSYVFEYELNNAFFNLLDDAEVTEGNVNAEVRITNSQGNYSLEIEIDGYVFIPCDRCLDNMKQEVNGCSEFTVKFGNGDEDSDILYVSEESGLLNMAWLMYETIALHIPMIHTHDEDECNEEMLNKLHEHLSYELDELADENDENEANNRKTDPRWEGLKNIITN